MRKYMWYWVALAVYALIVLATVVACTIAPAVVDYEKGYRHPVYPPYCWIQKSPDPLWYVCGHHPIQKDHPEEYTPHLGH